MEARKYLGIITDAYFGFVFKKITSWVGLKIFTLINPCFAKEMCPNGFNTVFKICFYLKKHAWAKIQWVILTFFKQLLYYCIEK